MAREFEVEYECPNCNELYCEEIEIDVSETQTDNGSKRIEKDCSVCFAEFDLVVDVSILVDVDHRIESIRLDSAEEYIKVAPNQINIFWSQSPFAIICFI